MGIFTMGEVEKDETSFEPTPAPPCDSFCKWEDYIGGEFDSVRSQNAVNETNINNAINTTNSNSSNILDLIERVDNLENP